MAMARIAWRGGNNVLFLSMGTATEMMMVVGDEGRGRRSVGGNDERLSGALLVPDC